MSSTKRQRFDSEYSCSHCSGCCSHSALPTQVVLMPPSAVRITSDLHGKPQKLSPQDLVHPKFQRPITHQQSDTLIPAGSLQMPHSPGHEVPRLMSSGSVSPKLSVPSSPSSSDEQRHQPMMQQDQYMNNYIIQRDQVIQSLAGDIERRKESHRVAEQRRRREMQDTYDALRRTLMKNGSHDIRPRTTKVELIELANRRIIMLEEENAKLKEMLASKSE